MSHLVILFVFYVLVFLYFVRCNFFVINFYFICCIFVFGNFVFVVVFIIGALVK